MTATGGERHSIAPAITEKAHSRALDQGLETDEKTPTRPCSSCKGAGGYGAPCWDCQGTGQLPVPPSQFGSMPKDGSMTMGDGVDGLPYRTEPNMSYADQESIAKAREEAHATLAAQQAAAEAKDKAEGGLERRYHVERLNDTEGKHTDCRFFVLDPQHDPIAREALKTYANHAYAKGFVTLHDDLFAWLREVNDA